MVSRRMAKIFVKIFSPVFRSAIGLYDAHVFASFPCLCEIVASIIEGVIVLIVEHELYTLSKIGVSCAPTVLQKFPV